MKALFVLCTISMMITCCSGEDAPPYGVHRWKTAEIGYYLNREASELTESVVRQTFEKWGEATRFSFVYKGRHRAGLHRDGMNTVSFLLNWPPEIPLGKVAYCKTWYDSAGNIVESDIIFNMQVTRFTTLRTNKPDSYYIEGVLSHEIGHMIGLGHIDRPDSLMKQKSDAKESYFKGTIDKATVEAYQQLYMTR